MPSRDGVCRAAMRVLLGSVGALAATAFLHAPPAADAAVRDSDRDGLSNRFERTRSFTNPRRADTDRDGLTDRFEVRTTGTSPRKRDTDGDGLSDRQERRRFRTNPLLFDTDGDGTGDGLEVLLGTDPLKPDPPVPPPPDTTPPETTLGSGPSGTVASASASFAFSSSEPGSSFECRLDAGAWSGCSSPQAYSALANGPHSFSVRARDQAGNTDPTPATRDWTVNVPPPPDTTPPETTLGSGPSGTVASASASFAFSSSEPGSSFECRLDAGAWSGCSSPQAYSALANGPHSFSVRARDQAGNTDPTPATRDWTVALAPPGSLTLTPVDGGLGYYGRFAHPLPTSPDFFPIAVWGSYAHDDANIAKDKAVGINTYVWAADPNPNYLQNIREAGMHAFVDGNAGGSAVGNETVGRVLLDEIDMTEGPGACPGRLNEIRSGIVNDGRATYANYGKGVAFWQTDQQAACFVNGPQDITSTDVYWHTDPFETSRPQSQNSWGYGWLMERMRTLDRMDGVVEPQWGPFVEVGNAMNGSMGPPTPAEIRAAVWHGLIAGSRAVEYFQHDFNAPCDSHHALRAGWEPDWQECYGAVINMVTSVNAQVTSLARVLNSPFVTSGHTASSSVEHMVKWNGQNLYVFAAARTGGSASFSMPCVGDATAVRLGEPGSVPVSGGSFSDQFADGNAVHIYRIDGGSTCGLPPN
jgi:hypothetical protein